MTEAELSQSILLGGEAQALVESPAFQAAFAMLETELANKWKSSPVEDQAGRERLFQMQFLSQAVRANLESLILDGRMSRSKLQQMRERLQRSLPEWMNFRDET